jgi:hypothetical protein
VVKIFAFLDLEQISGDFEIEHFGTGSLERKLSFKEINICPEFVKYVGKNLSQETMSVMPIM